MAISLTPTTLGVLTKGVAISNVTLVASGGSTPYTYTVSKGALPAGLSLSGGVISGTPTTEGPYSFEITATDNVSATGVQAFAGVVEKALAISPTTLGALTEESALSPVNLTVAGGVGPYAFAVTEGQLPNGLFLDGTTGVISGTPERAGGYWFVVAIMDSIGQTGSRQFSGNVAPTASGVGPGQVNLETKDFVEVMVAERISGEPSTGRLAQSVGGFVTVHEGGDTPSIPAFEKQYLKRDKVID